MLQVLNIYNIALIEKLEITFSNGLHVLTGETGAGKSIIIDAVNFVLGERANRDLIKSGAQKASVQATFTITGDTALKQRLEEFGLDEDEEDTLVLSRDLTISGKSVCRINGTLVNLNTLKSISDLLVDIHGQHEHQTLLRPESHIRFLDAFDDAATSVLKHKLMEISLRMQKLQKELLSGFLSEQERVRRLDILAYQIKEIEAADLKDGEEEELTAQHQKLSNAQQILTALEMGYALLLDEDDGALLHASEAKRQIEGIRSLHEEYEDVYTRLTDTYYALEDVGYTLRDLKSDFEFQPDRLQIIEDRLDLIHTLERKYGGSIADILEFYQQACEQLSLLEKSDARREQLQAQRIACEEEYKTNAKKLTSVRKKAAKAIEQALIAQLKDLGMENARFEVLIQTLDGYSASGADTVEFLLSTNAGEPVKPLHRVASGGELSRIMLAFKTIQIDDIKTIIFDEVDAGISGYTATVVGQKMLQTAKTHQVICVTHLAQIAAMADVHYLVKKTEQEGNTISTVTRLDDDARIQELAHIMGATQTSARAMEHARELLLRSRNEA